MEWKYATVFISSSFNDMHAERDYLIKEVFPELTEWCEKYKIRLSDIDLRWGVSEETSKNKNTIEKCLSHIDKSRPFFLCFLGQRRGWIPDFDEDISDETINTFKDIENAYNGRSATEMEIEYALLTPLYNFLRQKECPPTRHSLFFLRDPSYLDDISPAQRMIYTNDELEDEDKIAYATQKSQEIIDEIKARKVSEDEKDEKDESKVHIEITDYEGTWNGELKIPELMGNPKFTNNEWEGRLTSFKAKTEEGQLALKDVIISQLKEQLKLAFGENFKNFRPETPLEKELNQQDNFCHINSEGYIERESDVNRLKDYIADEDENKICLVSSKAGYGKTMLLANFATYLEGEYTNKFNETKENRKHIYKRFCGASDDSSRVLSLWQSIVEEAGISKDSKYYPENMDSLKRNIPQILNEIASKKDSVIIIDAINQMPDGLNMLKWLSAPQSGNLKIIISVKEDPENEKYERQLNIIKKKSSISEAYSFELNPFESDEDKKALINKYLENYLKELGDDDIQTICKFPGSENPLYLKILLAELRVFGSFEQLSDKIKSFGDSPKEAFKQVLVRLEDDEQYSEADNVVSLLFSLLANARYGLSEKELVSIIAKELGGDDETKLNEITNAIRLNLRQVRPFLARKEGRHDYFYESFKLAAEEKYAGDKVHVNELLADYFMSNADPDGDLSFNSDEKDDSERSRPLNELPYHLNQAEKYGDLSNVLSSFAFIKNKLDLLDIYDLVADYQFEQEHEFMQVDDHPIVLIGRALELSAPVLENNKDQLSTQLWGRMNGIDDEVIARLLNEVDSSTSGKWLKSKTNSLYSPKSAIIKRIKPDGKKSTTAVAMVDDNIIVMGSEDGILNIFDVDDNEMETLEEGSSKVIKIILDDDVMLVANGDGTIKEWDINNKMVTKEYPKIDAEITDIYLSKTYQKIYASSHSGVYSINIQTDELKQEAIEAKNYNQILVPRRNEAILVCDEKEVDGWDVYEMKKAYNKHHQNNPDDEDMQEGSADTKMDSSGDIKFMGLNKRFLTLISENGQMKFWNTLKNSGGGESIDETFVCGFNDKFTQAKTLEDENQIITISEMGVLRVWNIPEPREPNFRKAIDIQTGIRSPTALDYYRFGENSWVIVGNKNNDVSIIDLNKKIEETSEIKHGETVLSIKLHNDDMITACENGEIYTWNFEDEKLLSDEFANDFRNNCISYNHSTSEVVSAGVRHEKDGRVINKIATWKVGDEKAEDYKTTNTAVVDIAQNSSDIIFIEENRLTVGENGTELSGNATTLATKFESGEIFVGFEDGSIVKYPGENSFDKVVDSAVTKIKITDDDRLIAGYEDGSVKLFSLDGTSLNVDGLQHEKAITNINVVSNSEIVTVSEDNTLKFWNLENSECIYTYFLDIYATAINVRGDKVVIGDTLGNVRFFEFEK